MKNFTKLGLIISCIVFFSFINGLAQADDHQLDISNPEFSRMDKDQDGLMSCTEMQAYQPDLFTEVDFGKMDNNNDNLVSEAEYTAYSDSVH